MLYEWKFDQVLRIGEDRSIMLWDLGSGRRLKKMTGHTGFIYSVDFSADSNVLVSGGADGTVRVWDVNKDTSSDGTVAALTGGVDAKRIRMDDSERGKSKDKKDKDKLRDDAKRKKGIIER